MPSHAPVRWPQTLAVAGGGGLLAAIVHVLIYPPFGIWWLVPLAPASVAIVATRCPRWSIVLGLGLPMIGAWLWHAWWVGGISVAGLPPLVVYLAVWTPLTALILRRLLQYGPAASWPLAALVPIVWVGLEIPRALVVFDGYPWYLLGQPLLGWLPLAQVADIGGVCLVGLLPAAVGGLLADLASRRGSTRMRAVAVGCCAILAVAWAGYGWSSMRPVGAGVDGPRILAIQTDLPQSLKVGWSPEQQWRDALRFAGQTIDAVETVRAEGTPVDLVAWPETMLPGVGLDPTSTEVMEAGGWWPGTRFVDLATDLQARVDAPLLLGSGSFERLRVEDERLAWDARFNSVYLLDHRGPELSQRYDKVVLTPFGERMPYISAWPWLEARLLAIGAAGMAFDLDEGRWAGPLQLASAGPDEAEVLGIATPICFEDTVPDICRRLVWSDGRRQASVILNLSNDGWFGSWAPARESHFEFSRFRAIENRTPVVRVVNTGDSGWIDSDGRIRGRLPGPDAGWLLARPRLDDRRPIYARVGELPATMWAGGLLVLLVWSLLSRGDPRIGTGTTAGSE